MPLVDIPTIRDTSAPRPSSVRPLPPRRVLQVFGALLFATAACVGMVVGRSFYLGAGPTFYYLIWNLVLAWIPLVFSYTAYRFYAQRTRRNVLFAVCALAWFLFFPNAPYITTDVVHIHDDHVSASWFHLISIMSYAWTGLSLGYLSLYLMQEVVRARCGRVIEWCFVFVMLGAGTVGIYLGRFLRWNSWDVLRHPVGYLKISYHSVRPFDEPGKMSFMGLMFLFMLLSYGILYALTHLHEPARAAA